MCTAGTAGGEHGNTARLGRGPSTSILTASAPPRCWLLPWWHIPILVPKKQAKTPSTHSAYTRRCVRVFGNEPLGFLPFKYSRRCLMVVSGAVCIRETPNAKDL